MSEHIHGRRVSISTFGETPMDAVENHLTIVDMAQPNPMELAPGGVLVRVRAAAVGWVDLLMGSGQYQHMASPPYTPGLEYAGEVAAVGSAVTRWRAGDRVIADGLRTGPRSLGAYRAWGGFATWALAPEDGLLPLPDAWTYAQGCNLLGNYETAWHVLVARGKLQAGETVLIHGASGNTGLAAVHIAKLLDARVIATGRSPEKLAVVKAQGADHVVCTAEEGAMRDAVKAITGGRGVDVVYDGVGGDISVESLRCVRFGARFLVVGWAATPFVAQGRGQRGAPNANQLPTNLIMMKGLDVLGCPTAIATHTDPSIRQARLDAILAWVSEGKLTPVAGPEYDIEDVRTAMADKWASRHVGGCTLVMG